MSIWIRAALVGGLLVFSFATQAKDCEVPDLGKAPYPEEGQGSDSFRTCAAQVQRVQEKLLYLETLGFRPRALQREHMRYKPQLEHLRYSNTPQEWKTCIKVLNSLRSSLITACARMDKSEEDEDNPGFSGKWELLDQNFSRPTALRLRRAGRSGYAVTPRGGTARIARGRAIETENGLSLNIAFTAGGVVSGHFRFQDGEGKGTCLFTPKDRRAERFACELVRSP